MAVDSRLPSRPVAALAGPWRRWRCCSPSPTGSSRCRRRLPVRARSCCRSWRCRWPALGLNLLTGYCGQLSLGSAAFMAVGAFAAYNFDLRVAGLPLLASHRAGRPDRGGGRARLRPAEPAASSGFYLAVSTLAAQFFVQWALTKFGWFSNDSASGVISAPRLDGRRRRLRRRRSAATCFALTIVILLTVARLAAGARAVRRAT